MDSETEIRALRRALNWNQAQMGAYLGVERSTVSRMERGRTPNGAVQRILDLLSSELAQARQLGRPLPLPQNAHLTVEGVRPLAQCAKRAPRPKANAEKVLRKIQQLLDSADLGESSEPSSDKSDAA